MLIITGTGRSGTATLARMFSGHHEFRAAYILEKYFLNRDPHERLFRTLQERLSAVLDLHQGIDPGTFVDSSNLYIHYIDAVYLLNPHARFILSVRNGKDFVRSALSRGWHKQNLPGTVPHRGDPFFEKWTGMGPLGRNAWIWTYRNRKALEGLGVVPEAQKLILRIEDLGSELDRLETFAAIPLKDRESSRTRHNANPSFNIPPKEEWTNEMDREFDEIAGDMMRFFGYS